MQAHWEHKLLALAGDLPHTVSRPPFAHWAGDARLHQAYQVCDRITRQYSKSFFLASALLPEQKRSAARALYAFCRTVDDLVDESAGEADREAGLAYWKQVIQTGSVPDDQPVAAAWVDTLQRYHIPRHYALQLIEGVNRDLKQRAYACFEDLATYCYGVASTVGLMSMYIVGFKGEAALPYAIKLGVALQMTNILRDVGEDLRRGRVYLPQDELDAFGLKAADLSAGAVSDAWRAFMKFQIERTRRLYAESWQGIGLLERQGHLAIAAASDFYQGILEDIEAHDYDTFNRRASLSAWAKLKRLPALWWRVRRDLSRHPA